MVKHDLRVTSYELKFKSASSDPRVTSSNRREPLNQWKLK